MADPSHGDVLREFSQRDVLRTIKTFDLTEVREHADFTVGHDRRLEELAREAAAAAAERAELVLVAPAASLIDLSLIPGREEFDLLADARANIQDGAYGLAEEQLAEYLEGDPAHQEARFLRAYCLFHLGGEERAKDALRILRLLRDERAEPELHHQIRTLRGELRRRLAPREVLAYTKTARTDPTGALARVREFLELVPEDGTLSYILSLGFALEGDLELALSTATRGAADADTGRERVAALARMLSRLVVPQVAASAVDAFWDGDLLRARRELAHLDPRWRDNVLLGDFTDYIGLRLARPGQVPPPPRVPADRAEDLYSLIAESECEQAMSLIHAGHADQAERLLAGAMTLVPRFGWLNFLYAVCLYHLGRDPDRAVSCAEIAARDASIGQAADLLDAIREWQEASVINPALDEYGAIMKSVQGSVTSTQLAVLRSRLTALQQRLPRLRTAARTATGTRVVTELSDAIAKRLSEVAQVETQANLARQVSDLVTRFNLLARQLGTIGLVAARSQLNAILRDVRVLQGQPLDAQDRTLLEELTAVIVKLL